MTNHSTRIRHLGTDPERPRREAWNDRQTIAMVQAHRYAGSFHERKAALEADWGPDMAKLALRAELRLRRDRARRASQPRSCHVARVGVHRPARARTVRSRRVACAAKPTSGAGDPDPEPARPHAHGEVRS